MATSASLERTRELRGEGHRTNHLGYGAKKWKPADILVFPWLLCIDDRIRWSHAYPWLFVSACLFVLPRKAGCWPVDGMTISISRAPITVGETNRGCCRLVQNETQSMLVREGFMNSIH